MSIESSWEAAGPPHQTGSALLHPQVGRGAVKLLQRKENDAPIRSQPKDLGTFASRRKFQGDGHVVKVSASQASASLELLERSPARKRPIEPYVDDEFRQLACGPPRAAPRHERSSSSSFSSPAASHAAAPAATSLAASSEPEDLEDASSQDWENQPPSWHGEELRRQVSQVLSHTVLWPALRPDEQRRVLEDLEIEVPPEAVEEDDDHQDELGDGEDAATDDEENSFQSQNLAEQLEERVRLREDFEIYVDPENQDDP